MSSVACSCGVEGCRELGWPHEWDPIACGDTCVLCGAARLVGIRVDPIRGVVNLYERAPVIEAPYVRWGSGYAHAACAAKYVTNPDESPLRHTPSRGRGDG